MRTRFDLMRPVVGEKVGREQARQKQHHDTRARFRQFAEGTRVMVEKVETSQYGSLVPY